MCKEKINKCIEDMKEDKQNKILKDGNIAQDLFLFDEMLFFLGEIPKSHVLGAQTCGATLFPASNNTVKLVD